MRELPDLSIRQLQYLVAVAESETFTQAAKLVGVSASALSQGLAELERRLGLVLFERQGRRRLLRPVAGPAVDHARQVVALTSDVARWARRVRTGAQGELRLGMIDVAAVHYYNKALSHLRAAHQGLRLLLRVAPSADLLDELRAGTLDLGVCVDPPLPVRGVVVEPLLSEALGIYAPDGRDRPGPSGGWGPWVLFPAGSHTRALTESALRAAGAAVDVVAESHHPEVLRKMVRLGLGWTVLPVAQAGPGDPASEPLVRAEVLTRRHLVTARRNGAAPNPVAQRLENELHSATR